MADIRLAGRATQGVRLINLEKRNDTIASVCCVDSDPEEEVNHDIVEQDGEELEAAVDNDAEEMEEDINDEAIESDDVEETDEN